MRVNPRVKNLVNMALKVVMKLKMLVQNIKRAFDHTVSSKIFRTPEVIRISKFILPLVLVHDLVR